MGILYMALPTPTNLVASLIYSMTVLQTNYNGLGLRPPNTSSTMHSLLAYNSVEKWFDGRRTLFSFDAEI